ncbi:MAG: DUF362 domain-containing protein [bacterium]
MEKNKKSARLTIEMVQFNIIFMKAKVSLVQCDEYKEEKVDKAIDDAVALIGGIERFIKRGDKVIIKVNLLQATPSDAAITTHPSLVKSLIGLVKEMGAIPLIGDSPGGAFLNIERTWQVTGMSDIARRMGVELVNFEADPPVEITNPDGKFFTSFYIARPIVEADKIISVPKCKTHSLLLFSGAVKNLLGVVPGLLKIEFHKRCPHPYDLAEAIVELFSVIKPHLSIMDAIVALEGDGPGTGGQPRKLGYILASNDTVALDAVTAKLINIEPFRIHTTRIATQKNLGTGNLEDIDIVGKDRNSMRGEELKLPKTSPVHWLPGFVISWLTSLIKVKVMIDKTQCCMCQLCAKSCPVSAIRKVDNFFVIDNNQCIACLCCHEFCPHKAIKLKRSFMHRRFVKDKI